MYTEATPQNPRDTAKLISPMLQFRGYTCIQFYYHMYGALMGTLYVYVHLRNVFYASGDKGNMWHKANINFYIWGRYKVRRYFMSAN